MLKAVVMSLLVYAALELIPFLLPPGLLRRRLGHYCSAVWQLAEDQVADPAAESLDRSMEECFLLSLFFPVIALFTA